MLGSWNALRIKIVVARLGISKRMVFDCANGLCIIHV